MHLGRIEFNIVLFMDWSFASGCSPPRISTTQLPSATDRPAFPSGRDFHPPVGAYFQAHLPRQFVPGTIRLSLRDKSHSPIAAAHNYLSAYGFRIGPVLNHNPIAENRERGLSMVTFEMSVLIWPAMR